MKKCSGSLHVTSPRRKLWLGFWGGGLAWFAHLLAAYALGEFGCFSGWGKHQFLAISTVAWLLLLMSAICIAAAALSTLLAWRMRLQLQRGFLNENPPENTEAALIQTALIANSLFLFVIVVQTVPVFFFLRNC